LSVQRERVERARGLQVLYERGAGSDVQKRPVVATLLVTEASGRVTKRARPFSTMTADLLRREAGLAEEPVEQVARESRWLGRAGG
jgi:hypothetical protein